MSSTRPSIVYSKFSLTMFLHFLLLLVTSCPWVLGFAQSKVSPPVRIAVAGITHGHVPGILGRPDKGDIKVVAVYEPNHELALRYAQRFGFSPDIIYDNLGKMLDAVKPEAVAAFGSIYEHMAVVEACAPRGIHVMVEKPLAVNLTHALRMEALAKKYKIQLLTNYETTWYPTNEKVYQLVNDSGFIGRIRKVVIHDGHQGPKEIGVNKEFLQWLTDPVQNGAGALMDFGCYGANLMTYLMKGQAPLTVTAVTQQFKPQIYPKVDDEATIIATYPGAQCIIQASWNWPYSRKDMEVYGEKGYLIAVNKNTMRLRESDRLPELSRQVTDKDVEIFNDPFAYLAAVVRHQVKVKPTDLSSLQNNVTVMRILEAAKTAAKTGKTVVLKN